MNTTIRTSRAAEIDYPETDGEPIAENTLQFRWIVTIKEGLEVVFRHDQNVFVAGDLFWYPEEGKPKIRTAPDTMIVFGRPKSDRGSYKQWMEGNVAPQVVFEMLSPGNLPAETIHKFRFYERYGVAEYYIYNPENGDLVGWLRGDAGLEEIPNMNGYTSPRLGIRFEPGEGGDNLRIIGPDGRAFATFGELYDDREAQFQRAEAEHKRAEAEREPAEAGHARAEAERERAASLAAKLREMGVEPD
jgi:Uma2 family endonuclease